jgi:hypothetical protein
MVLSNAESATAATHSLQDTPHCSTNAAITQQQHKQQHKQQIMSTYCNCNDSSGNNSRGNSSMVGQLCICCRGVRLVPAGVTSL